MTRSTRTRNSSCMPAFSESVKSDKSLFTLSLKAEKEYVLLLSLQYE